MIVKPLTKKIQTEFANIHGAKEEKTTVKLISISLQSFQQPFPLSEEPDILPMMLSQN